MSLFSRIFTGLFIAILILLLLLRLEIIGNPMVNMSFRLSDEKIQKAFEGSKHSPSINYLDFQGKQLRYLTLHNDTSKAYVVFIHGAPGSSTDYINYFKDSAFHSRYNLVSMDRLGYGYSEFGHAETSMEQQAASIQTLIEKHCKNQRIILVGHSYGGPIAVRMAMDYPDRYKAILLLAPALDPNNEKVIKIAHLGTYKLTSMLTPPAIRTAAFEKTTHVEELEKMLPLYPKIKIPVHHLHGTKDSLVPFANLQFSLNHFGSNFKARALQEVDHFLPWSHYDLIVEKIDELASL